MVSAKLNPRLASLRQVPRTRLVEQMHAAMDAALILVHGPAGFGKTTTMLQYYAQSGSRGVAVGWLTLDRADNDVVRFLRYLGDAFGSIDATMTPAAQGQAAAADGDAAVVDLIEHFTAFQDKYVLFLDDFELIESPVVLGLVRQIAEHLPRNGQLVIGSRTLPDLGIGRLRAHGRLVEIETAQLRFNPAETMTFLRQQNGLTLRDADIRQLQERTEGWPAGLWLVSLALRDRADPQAFIQAFDGANTAIAEYLLEDVLGRQDDQVRRFLLYTSVLQELSAPLCDALLESGDSREMLMRIERAHLFLLSQGEDRQWYRYHPLFGDFLRAQLRRSEPQAIPLLHLRAARWWLAAGQSARAIEHALHGGDGPYLLSLLSAHVGDMLWRGRARTLARWYAALPGAVALDRAPALMLDFAWSLTLTRRYDASLRLLDSVGAASPSGDLGAGEAEAFAVETRAQRAFIMAMSDRIKESSALWRSCVPDMASMRPVVYAMLGASFGYCLVAENRFDEARRFLGQARRRALEIGNSFIGPMALCLEGTIDFAQGHLRDAIASFRSASSRGSQLSYVGGNAILAGFLAEALYETGQLGEAERFLTRYLPMFKETAAPDQLITSFTVLARIALSRGQREAALEFLDELEATGLGQGMPRLVASARLERGRMALLDGEIEAAQAFLASASERHIWEPFDGLVAYANDADTPLIADLRWRMRSGKAASTLAALKDALKQAQDQHRHRRALKLSILLAQALCATGQKAAGLRRLHDVLTFAAREGFVRTLIDEGSELLSLIAELRNQMAPSPNGAAGLIDFIDRLLDAGGVVHRAHDGPSLAPGGVAGQGESDTLTKRELQVLRLLAEGDSNRSMAERLFVSETTVKAHLRSINVKLGTQSRTQAVAVARQLRLV
jgi:LuxR family maltose regulon positive regulatory protein